MKRFQLIYFKDCPNADPAKKLLSSLGLDFENVEQDQLPAGDSLLSYTSPSLLFGDQLIFGSRTGTASRGCSLGLPSKEDLQVKIKAAISQ